MIIYNINIYSNKMNKSLQAVRVISNKYIVVDREGYINGV